MADLVTALADCLTALESGETTVADCLARHPEHRAELSQLLRLAQQLRQAGAVRPSEKFRVETKERLLRRAEAETQALADALEALERGDRQVEELTQEAAAQLDPLLGLAQQLRAVPRARPSSAFLQRARRHWLPPASPTTPLSTSPGRRRQLALHLPHKRVAIAWAALLLFFLILGGGVVDAAGEALPGELLYPAKMEIEELRLALSFDEANDAALHLAFASERVAELQHLVAQEQLDEVEAGIGRYLSHLATAKFLSDHFTEPGERERLALQFNQTLAQHEAAIAAAGARAPAAAQALLEAALDSAHAKRRAAQAFLIAAADSPAQQLALRLQFASQHLADARMYHQNEQLPRAAVALADYSQQLVAAVALLDDNAAGLNRIDFAPALATLLEAQARLLSEIQERDALWQRERERAQRTATVARTILTTIGSESTTAQLPAATPESPAPATTAMADMATGASPTRFASPTATVRSAITRTPRPPAVTRTRPATATPLPAVLPTATSVIPQAQTPTGAPVPAASATPASTATTTAPATATPTPATALHTATSTPRPTATVTSQPLSTDTATLPAATVTTTPTPSRTPAPSWTATPWPSATFTPLPTETPTSTLTPQPTPSHTATSPPSANCTQTLNCFTVEFLGYVIHPDGSTEMSLRVTNLCQQSVGYVALGTDGWSRISPADGSTYMGSLGSYQVEWTGENGQPGYPSIKYEAQFDGFAEGASDHFAGSVAGFDAATAVRVTGKAGFNEETFTFIPATCQP